MRKILACTLFLSILLGCATATAQSRKERRAKRKAKTEKQASKSTHTPVSVKPEKTVTEKTTVQQTEPYCPELNRNLTPAQIDSLVALWREKQTLQSYDTFFNDYIDIDSLASSSDTTPCDTRTPQQKSALEHYVRDFVARFPGAAVVGHNELAAKACPSFDVQAWLRETGIL